MRAPPEERKFIKKIIMFALAIMLVLSVPTGITAAAKPKAPTGVKAVSVNGTTIKLTWKKVSGVGGYYIYRAPKKTGKFVKIATAKKTATSYTNTKLKPSTYYYYRIYSYKKVKKKNVMSKPSAIASARTIQRVTGISKRTEPAMFTIRVDKSLVDFYDHLAQQTNRSRNEVISMALEFAREHIRIDENDGGK